MAWRIKQLQTERAITSLINQDGESIIDPIIITDAFRRYYENLYTCGRDPELPDQKIFLENINFPKISTEDRLLLEDISSTIKCLKSGKAAGPDSLPSDFYKKSECKLLTPLLEMFRESVQKGILPPSLRGAFIILRPKPGKANDKCEHLRPISLLKSHLKTLCKILAKRLETFLQGSYMKIKMDSLWDVYVSNVVKRKEHSSIAFGSAQGVLVRCESYYSGDTFNPFSSRS